MHVSTNKPVVISALLLGGRKTFLIFEISSIDLDFWLRYQLNLVARITLQYVLTSATSSKVDSVDICLGICCQCWEEHLPQILLLLCSIKLLSPHPLLYAQTDRILMINRPHHLILSTSSSRFHSRLCRRQWETQSKDMTLYFGAKPLLLLYSSKK